MKVVGELGAVLTLDQAQGLADSHPTPVGERDLSTQQVLDELLGRFDDEESLMCLTHGFRHEHQTVSDE